jgi:hypothetical protein
LTPGTGFAAVPLSPEEQRAAVEQFRSWKARDRDSTRVVPEEEMAGPVRLDGSDLTRQVRNRLRPVAQ